MTVNVSGRVPRVVTVNKGRAGPAGADGDGVSPDTQFRNYAVFSLARQGDNPPADADVVLILEDERYGDITISGTAIDVENFDGSGSGSVVSSPSAGDGGAASVYNTLRYPTVALVPGGLSEGQKVDVEADENNSGNPSQYTFTSGSLLLNRVLTPLATTTSLQGTVSQHTLDIALLQNQVATLGAIKPYLNRAEYNSAVANNINPPVSGDLVLIRADSSYGNSPTMGSGAQFAADAGITVLGGAGGGATINDATTSTSSVWSSSKTNTEIQNAVAGVSGGTGSSRTFESFGTVGNPVTSVAHQQAMTAQQKTDNYTALVAARDWCRDNGGKVTFLGRKYAFNQTLVGHSYLNLEGAGMEQTHLVWDQGMHAITCEESDGNSSYGITLAHLQIGNEAWNHNQTEANATQYSAVHIVGRNTGPNDAEAYAREGVAYLSDPYHRFFFVAIREFDGNGFSLAGRGEIDISHCSIRRVSGYGIYTTAPDLWITHNTVSETGTSGLYMNSGNVTLANNKFWFTGKLSNETVGAGMEFFGSGKANVTSTNDRIQDTWGPGVVVEGGHFNFVGLNITEPAGGRVESQGDGFTGARTEPRCAIRFENAKGCKIDCTVQNGNFTGLASGDYPYLVYHANSGGRGNYVDIRCEAGNNWRDTLEIAGWTNADRWSRVVFNGDELLGAVDQADLSDASHGVNDANYRPGAGVNLTNGGRAHWKGSEWGIQAQSSTATPA